MRWPMAPNTMWTDEAVTSLVGQEVPMNVEVPDLPFYRSPNSLLAPMASLGVGRVVDAARDDDHPNVLLVELEVPWPWPEWVGVEKDPFE